MSSSNNSEITRGVRVRRGNNTGTVYGNPWPDQLGTMLVSVQWDTEVFRNSNWFITLETVSRLEVIR